MSLMDIAQFAQFRHGIESVELNGNSIRLHFPSGPLDAPKNNAAFAEVTAPVNPAIGLEVYELAVRFYIPHNDGHGLQHTHRAFFNDRTQLLDYLSRETGYKFEAPSDWELVA